MSVIKTALFFLVLVSMTMGGIYIKRNAAPLLATSGSSEIAPIIIGNGGSVRFPKRFPNPEVLYEIRTAVKTDDFETLNDLLVKHNFYLLPERMQKVN